MIRSGMVKKTIAAEQIRPGDLMYVIHQGYLAVAEAWLDASNKTCLIMVPSTTRKPIDELVQIPCANRIEVWRVQ